MLTSLAIIACLSLCAAAPAGFVTTRGTSFEVDGLPFRFAGTNNYYLQYQDAAMVADVLDRAAARNFSVLRTWAFLDIGYPDGSESVGGGAKNGVWFRALDPSTKKVVLNDSGLAHLDATLAAAAARGLRLILTLTNNWIDFGGADQQIRWEALIDPTYTDPKHDDFFTRPWQISTFVAYAEALAGRTNSLTGVKYSDDPTILAWELINEPRCQGSGAYTSSNNCTLNYAQFNKTPVAFKIPPWIDTVSTALKAADPNHLIAVGDEGFLCEEYQTFPNMVGDCYVGTDFVKQTALPHIDFGSFHLYPDAWGQGQDAAEWGAAWIANHSALAGAVGKPLVLGEFGVKDAQAATYAAWTSQMLAGGVAGDLFWMLCGRQDFAPPWYPNYDGFCVYCANNASEPKPPGGDAQSCSVLAAHAAAMAAA
jgi:mannan endo-1,4-beta-mannosidase